MQETVDRRLGARRHPDTVADAGEVGIYDVTGGVVAVVESASGSTQFVAIAADQDSAVDVLNAVAEVQAAE